MNQKLFNIAMLLSILTFLYACNDDKIEILDRVPESAPQNLLYQNYKNYVQVGSEWQSVKPEVLADGVSTFAINGVSLSQEGEKVGYSGADFNIDSESGVISLPDANEIPSGNYSFAIEVENEYGKTIFEDALGLMAYSENFPYKVFYPILEFEEAGTAQEITPSIDPEFKSGQLFFRMISPLGVSGLSVSDTSGVITMTEGNQLSVGNHELKIEVIKNEKEKMIATAIVNITGLKPNSIEYPNSTMVVELNEFMMPVDPSQLSDVPIVDIKADQLPFVLYRIEGEHADMFDINEQGQLALKDQQYGINQEYDLEIYAYTPAGESSTNFTVNTFIPPGMKITVFNSDFSSNGNAGNTVNFGNFKGWNPFGAGATKKSWILKDHLFNPMATTDEKPHGTYGYGIMLFNNDKVETNSWAFNADRFEIPAGASSAEIVHAGYISYPPNGTVGQGGQTETTSLTISISEDYDPTSGGDPNNATWEDIGYPVMLEENCDNGVFFDPAHANYKGRPVTPIVTDIPSKYIGKKITVAFVGRYWGDAAGKRRCYYHIVEVRINAQL
ncbi:hypothetical protein [Aureibacter tunicatorum]|uniref:DUF4958 domain-containing protein n=1 Tax=Aureibacter tunicatorum TaxID=866807 RepID=A0AAE3XS43_9BACT|nr:hypothetical protein [Aureibacter tunicatorum]MDR6241758.1 hypothetical protein [Aureibacter tunicatorum]BDD07381.1 hypothetical protein AUTU_48640 [Aureibacter tunicatorum]